MRDVRRVNLGVAILLILVAGCATSFKYNPRHAETYPPVANNLGVEITSAQDLRHEDERQPEWSRKATLIVARAVQDELEHAKLFQRVKIHLSGPLPNNHYSHIIVLRVLQFRYYNPTNMFDYGREALNWMGVRGALIARSIPRKYISTVQVEFIVRDAKSGEVVWDKCYFNTHGLTANGYEGKSRQIQQTSDALEAVVDQFVADLAQLPLSQRPP